MDLPPRASKALAALGARRAAAVTGCSSLLQRQGDLLLTFRLENARSVPPLGAALDALAKAGLAVTSLKIDNPEGKAPACTFDDAALEELLASRAAGALQRLELDGLGLPLRGLAALAGATGLEALTELRFRWERPGPAGMEALCQGPGLARLKVLHLSGAGIGEGARALAAAPFAPTLQELKLWFAGLGPAGVAGLVSGPGYPRLQTLELWGAKVGNAGAAVLARSRAFPRLTTLQLGRCQLGDAGLAALAGGAAFPACKTLRLAENGFGAAGIAALAKSSTWPALRDVDVSYCQKLSVAGLKPLVFSKSLESLTTIRRSSITPPEWPSMSGRKLRTS